MPRPPVVVVVRMVGMVFYYVSNDVQSLPNCAPKSEAAVCDEQ